MKIIVSILLLPVLLAGSLLGSYDAPELAKMGNLVRHYVHHVQDHGQSTLTFLDFLHDHFDGSAGSDEEHDSLPLLGGSSPMTTSVELPTCSTNLTVAVADAPYPALADHVGVPHLRTPDVFQPPRQI
ncbi:MAG: hypothetical protein FGM33_05405 [Candidatus Kapabacteria bacterium]|nr:hypothetical protein [Candidatus Kapabacteria bacterium]